METQSHYRINVSKISSAFKTTPGNHSHTGKHFFAVNVIGKDNARGVFSDISEKYPHPVYEVSMTYWSITGTQIDTNTD